MINFFPDIYTENSVWNMLFFTIIPLQLITAKTIMQMQLLYVFVCHNWMDVSSENAWNEQIHAFVSACFLFPFGVTSWVTYIWKIADILS